MTRPEVQWLFNRNDTVIESRVSLYVCDVQMPVLMLIKNVLITKSPVWPHEISVCTQEQISTFSCTIHVFHVCNKFACKFYSLHLSCDFTVCTCV